MIQRVCVLWVAMGWLTFALPAHGQDFLKQLEERLRQAQAAAGKKPATEGASDAAPAKPGETANPGETVPTEELPIPGASVKESAAPPMQLPEVKPKSQAPLVITPRKSPAPRSLPPRSSALEIDELPPGNPGTEGGYLGLTLEPVEGGGFGLAVVEVMPQSPAWKGGFREGDRVIGIAGQAVSNIDQFAEELEKFPPGTPVKFLVQRRGRSVNLTAVPQDRSLAAQLQGLPAVPPPTPRVPYEPIAEALIAEGGLVLGVSVSDLSEAFRRQFGIPVYRGASISEVVVGSAAERAGLRPGDVIVEIDGRMISFADDVLVATRSALPGQSMAIGFYRGRQKMIAEVRMLTAADMQNPVEPATGFEPAPATSEYVAQLENEIARLKDELTRMQRKVQALELRLQKE